MVEEKEETKQKTGENIDFFEKFQKFMIFKISIQGRLKNCCAGVKFEA